MEEKSGRCLFVQHRAAGVLHVGLMFLIMCEELIRNGRRRRTLRQAGHGGSNTTCFKNIFTFISFIRKKIIGVKMSIFISHIIITDRRVRIGRKKPYLGGQITIFKNGN